ncbi:MAG: preprotein translocase subunit SecE [Candidatus Omnitrophica bacterium]|nr:preprotein translocase subunit SecE [Candidatus Omnitrophota bacterium]MDD5429175.1 preprotein translocase subunit SecE [Candidatus Omnitrophota bacterium]
MIKKIKSIPGFFKEVKEEVKKVNWSTRKELFSAAVVVLIVSVLLTTYIFGVDTGLSHLVKIILG